MTTQKNEGLVLHYAFDEGSGLVVHDKSGCSNNGTIRGQAEWIKKDTHAGLEFNGADTYVECPASSSLQLSGEGSLEIWCRPESIQGGLISWHTGPDGPNRRLVLGFVQHWFYGSKLSGFVADGTEHWGGMTEPWRFDLMLEVGQWSHVVMTFDGGIMRLFQNGRQRALTPQNASPDLKGVPLRIGVGEGLGDAHYRGQIGEVRVYQQALSPTKIAAQFLSAAKTWGLKQGAYKIGAEVFDSHGTTLGGSATKKWEQPPAAQTIETDPGSKILNNLVTTLVELDSITLQSSQQISFVNPRDGWIFVSSTCAVGNDQTATISIDNLKEKAVIVHCSGDAETQEAMQFLKAGAHKLHLSCSQPGQGATVAIDKLIVRAVPALMYCTHPATSAAGYGDYDFEFLEKDVLPNINVIVGKASSQHEDLHKQWHERGGRWYHEQDTPCITRAKAAKEQETVDIPDPVTADFAYKWWAESEGFASPDLDGVFADEFVFTNSCPDYPAYIEAIKRIGQDQKFKDKALHLWIGADLYADPLATTVLQTGVDAGYLLGLELYYPEMPSAAWGRNLLYGEVRKELARWEKALPGFMRRLVAVMGIFTTPPLGLNTNPQVDFKVWLDMQFNYLATSPECFGLYGVMAYGSELAEEEVVRWAGRLLRHYCIEGRTDLLSEQYGFKYELNHIRNADFDEGLSEWAVAEAEPGAVTTGRLPGLSDILGRYIAPTSGNHYLRIRRCAEKPNRISQQIANLKPGKLYSLKLLAADSQDVSQGRSEKKRVAVRVNIDGADVIPTKSFVSDIQGTWRACAGPYKDKQARPWLNYHRLVFRAAAATAKLTLSDWADDEHGGGPVGQEVLCNFIEVQPYLED